MHKDTKSLTIEWAILHCICCEQSPEEVKINSLKGISAIF